MVKKDLMDFEQERKKLTEYLMGVREIKPRVINAMNRIPRHLFVPDNLKSSAYLDMPLPIGYNQTISAPHMVAIMCDLLDLKSEQEVLEIGAGSGYNAAVMSELVGDKGCIYTLERIPELVDFARENLKKIGITNVKVMIDDGTLRVPDKKKFDRIVVTCAAQSIPKPLIDQLKINGLLVIPIGVYLQELYRITLDETGKIHKENKGSVSFVPLIGKYESYEF